MAPDREQSPRQVLQAHGRGPPAPRTASRPLAARLVRGRERTGGRMTFFRRVASVVRWIVGRTRAERDLHDELEAFVEMAAADRMDDGAAPAEARRSAVLHLGGVEQVKERVRSG